MATDQRPVVIVANEQKGVADGVATLAVRLGFEPVVVDIEPSGVGRLVEATGAAAALVAIRPTKEAAADVVGAFAAVGCPPVVLIATVDQAFARTVSARGAYSVSRYDGGDVGAALEIALRRSDDRRALLAAFDRRATIEQAKGLLMARHGIDGDHAFAMLRRHSQRSNRKLVDIAEALVRSHELLQSVRRPAQQQRQPELEVEQAKR